MVSARGAQADENLSLPSVCAEHMLKVTGITEELLAQGAYSTRTQTGQVNWTWRKGRRIKRGRYWSQGCLAPGVNVKK